MCAPTHLGPALLPGSLCGSDGAYNLINPAVDRGFWPCSHQPRGLNLARRGWQGAEASVSSITVTPAQLRYAVHSAQRPDYQQRVEGKSSGQTVARGKREDKMKTGQNRIKVN